MLKSGGPIKNFDEGWALIYPSKVIHYWVLDFWTNHRADFKSLCGVWQSTNPNKSALKEGTWPRCKKCLKLVQ